MIKDLFKSQTNMRIYIKHDTQYHIYIYIYIYINY